MNCTRIAPWLPLYASDDLSAPQMAEVRAHLADCESCAASAAEFAATQAWLQQAEAPLFDETFYADLRYAVQQELAAEPVRATWWPITWWKPVAVTAALLLLTIFSVRLFQTKGVQRPDNRTDLGKAPASSPTPDATPAPMPPINVLAQTQKSRVLPRKPPHALRIKQTEKEAIVAATAASLTQPALPNVAGTVAEPVISRLEIQTADPNIRIIWLTQNTQRAAAEPQSR